VAASRSGRTGGSGARPFTLRRAAWIGGAFFAADLVLWHYAIEYVGAGLATVLGNTQVVLVGLLAWAIFRERPARSSLLAVPVAMVGIVLISGVLESGAYGSNPRLGAIYGLLTGIAYSGFLLALRWGAGERGSRRGAALRRHTREHDLRRPDRPGPREPGLHSLARGAGVADHARGHFPRSWAGC
jgi:drug/metabolite transporter (DMT)-like permease